MKRSTDRILTTHAGSLSRPANLIEMNRARASGESKDHKAYAQCLAAAVADVVRKQRDAGVDIVDDGEFGKPMAAHYDYGVWWNYASRAWPDLSRRIPCPNPNRENRASPTSR
jgi:5-methyltetrahydropteroyltriglutamate--homocysteine methyltransferase